MQAGEHRREEDEEEPQKDRTNRENQRTRHRRRWDIRRFDNSNIGDLLPVKGIGNPRLLELPLVELIILLERLYLAQ